MTVWMLSGEILINEQQVQFKDLKVLDLVYSWKITSYCGTRTRGNITWGLIWDPFEGYLQ